MARARVSSHPLGSSMLHIFLRDRDLNPATLASNKKCSHPDWVPVWRRRDYWSLPSLSRSTELWQKYKAMQLIKEAVLIKHTRLSGYGNQFSFTQNPILPCPEIFLIRRVLTFSPAEEGATTKSSGEWQSRRRSTHASANSRFFMKKRDFEPVPEQRATRKNRGPR